MAYNDRWFFLGVGGELRIRSCPQCLKMLKKVEPWAECSCGEVVDRSSCPETAPNGCLHVTEGDKMYDGRCPNCWTELRDRDDFHWPWCPRCQWEENTHPDGPVQIPDGVLMVE